MSSQRSPTNPRAVTKRQRKASVSAPADPFAPSEKYYGDSKSHVSKARTYSEVRPPHRRSCTFTTYITPRHVSVYLMLTYTSEQHDPFINKMTSNQSHYRRGSHGMTEHVLE